MGFAVHQWAKTLIESMHLGFAEEMLRWVFVIVASMTTNSLLQVCPYSKEAIGGYDLCMVRYRSTNITMVRPSVYVYSSLYVSHVDQYNLALGKLLEGLRSQAAAGGPHLKFATGIQTGPDLQYIYALVQCTPEFSEGDCINCLDEAIGEISICCNGKIGARVLKAVCNVHYETNKPFFNTTRAVALPPSPGKKDNIRTVIIVVLTITFVILLIFCTYIILRKRKLGKQRKLRKPRQEDESVDEIISVEFLQYDFGTISVATDDFSDSNKLGQGGFGAVYRGRLQNGQEIAVKRLSKNSGQGEIEFKNEVMLLAKLQHRNLVRLLGFCLEGTERILIYEFVPHSSLDHFIFGLEMLAGRNSYKSDRSHIEVWFRFKD